jgi:hypothetical protein
VHSVTNDARLMWLEANAPHLFVEECGGYVAAEWVRVTLWQ